MAHLDGGAEDVPSVCRTKGDNGTRVLMLIDHLEAGGAQRQFCLLATSLQRRGFSVEVLVFRDNSFFANRLQVDGPIRVDRLEYRSLTHLVSVVRRAVRGRHADVAIGFLPWPNLLLELAGLPHRKFKLIVSERDLDVSPPGPKRFLRYSFHRLADAIVSNSYAQRDRIGEIAPRLLDRREVIVNGIDVDYVRPSAETSKRKDGKLRILALARFAPQKNVVRFLEAVELVYSRHPEVDVEVDWYGKKPVVEGVAHTGWGRAHRERMEQYFRSVEEGVSRRMMGGRFRLHEPRSNVRELYARADAVCLPSLHEGCSNVIGEAMACGVRVLARRVSDNVRLVEDGRNGFLFDPLSVDDMACAMVRFGSLSITERAKMGEEGRRMAEDLLSEQLFVGRYVDLVERLIGKKRACEG